jgi:hypothetical protein
MLPNRLLISTVVAQGLVILGTVVASPGTDFVPPSPGGPMLGPGFLKDEPARQVSGLVLWW